MPRRKILFYVQHLLGIGHLVRAGRIADALARDAEVVLAVGGELPPGIVAPEIALLRLPPVRAGTSGFSSLVHPDGTPFGDLDKALRRDALIAAFDRLRPDVLLVEAFPFGRRQMRFELLPLLDHAVAAVPRPVIASSVRDILQATSAERQAETVNLVHRFFDLVLVHGDPNLFPLSASFSAAGRIENKIRYTGMVGPDPSTLQGAGEHYDVIVSVGGGAVGADLLRIALAARPLTPFAAGRWLLLTGPNRHPAPSLHPPDGVTIKTFEPGLPALLSRARVSVSQAGYNTVADLAAARCRAVLVPFARDRETEQSQRATLLQARGWAVMLPEADLSPASLAAAIGRAATLPEPGPPLKLGGAEATRLILHGR